MNKLKLDIPELILHYLDDNRWMSPELEDFKHSLSQYYIEKEEVFINLIPYFCDYLDIIKIVSIEYKNFFFKNINIFFNQSIILGKKEVFIYLLENYYIDFKLLPLKNLLMISVYNYFNYDNSNCDSFYFVEWCFEICIKNNINIDCSKNDFLKLYMYSDDKAFNKEILYIENMKNISNF